MNALRAPRVVLVEPEYQINLGAAARACKNFGCADLRLVRPKARIGFTAKVFAKHAEEVLAKARKCATLAEAVRGCDIVIGTSGAAGRFKNRLKKTVTPRRAVELARGKQVALVFGGEGKGLDAADVEACDLIATIPSDPKQPILNLSHAVAVMLYEFYVARLPAKGGGEVAAAAKKRLLEQKFGRALAALNKTKGTGAAIRDEAKVARAFRNLLHRSGVEDDEAQALLAALTKMEKCGRRLRSTC